MTNSSTVLPMPASLQRWGRFLVMTLLVLGPIIYSPRYFLYNPLDTPRRMFLLLGAGLLGALLVASWASRRQFVLRWHPRIDRPVLFFLAAGLFTSLTTLTNATFYSTFGPIWSQDSVWLLVMGVLLYFGVKEFLREPADRTHAVFAMVAVGGLLAVLGLIDHVHPLPLSDGFSGHRLVSMLGNPMFTGTYFAMLIPLALGAGLQARGWQRGVLLACMVVMVPALILTMARAAWIGLALAFLVLLGIALSRLHAYGKSVLAPVAIGMLVLAIGAGVLIQVRPDVRHRVQNLVNLQDETAKTRLVYMQAAVNAFLSQRASHEHGEGGTGTGSLRPTPIIGWGMGNMRYVYAQYRPSSTVLEMGVPINRGFSSALPHNLPLQIAAEMGLLGLIPFVWLLIAIFRSALDLLRDPAQPRMLVIGLLGMLLAYLFSNLLTYDNSATLGYCWMGLGVLAAIGATTATPREKRRGQGLGLFTPAQARTMLVASMVVGIVTVLAVATQTAAAYLVQRSITEAGRGAQLIAKMQSVDAMERGAARLAVENAVTSAVLARQLSVIPEIASAQALINAYQLQTAFVTEKTQLIRIVDKQIGPVLLRTIMAFPRDSMVLTAQVMLQMQLQRYEGAAATLGYLRAVEPHSAEVHLMMADLFEAAGENASAGEEITRAVELDPTFGQAWANKGHITWVSLDPKNDKFRDDLKTAYDSYLQAEQHGFNFASYPPMIAEFALAALCNGDLSKATEYAAKVDLAQNTDFPESIKEVGALVQRSADAARLLKTVAAIRAVRDTTVQPAMPMPMLKSFSFQHKPAQ